MDNFTKQDFAKFMAFMRKQNEAEEGTSTTTITDRPETKLEATICHTDGDEDLGFGLKNDFLVEERLRSLTSQGRYYDAISLYEDFEYVGDTDIGLKLLIAECYIQLGRENKAEKAIRDIEKILMKPPECDAGDVMALANDLYDNSNCVRALLLLRIAGDMFFNNSSLSPDDKIGRVSRCISKMDDVIGRMVKPSDVSENVQNIIAIQRALNMDSDASIDISEVIHKKKKSSNLSERTRVLSLDYGVEVMEEMLEKMNSIKDADPEYKALKLARAAIYINSQYTGPAQLSKAVKVLKFGIEQLEKQFGENARQHQIYGAMLCNIASDFHNSEKFKEAEHYMLLAVEAEEYVLDFENEGKKRKAIRLLQEHLRITQSHIKFA